MEKKIIQDENTNEKVELNDTNTNEKVDEINMQEWEVDFTSDSEYIAAATQALAAIDSMDTALMTKADEQRVRRIRRQGLRIISECLNSLYDEIFDDNVADNSDNNE